MVAAARRSTRSPTSRRPVHLPPGLGFTPSSAKPTPRTKAAGSSPLVPVRTPSALRGGTFPCLAYVVVYHACAVGGLLLLHAREHGGVVSPTHLALSVFCAINAWICVCEIALFVHYDAVQRQYAEFTASLGEGVLPPVFLFERVRLAELFTLRYWAVMWSTYATLDPSYADTTTFGFCVDVGNGFTTLVPTVVFAIGMSGRLLSARALGMLGLLKFYQELYGTCVYFFQYCFNRRFDRSTRAHVWGVVVPANAIWIALPLLGMWASKRLIVEGNFAVFGGA